MTDTVAGSGPATGELGTATADAGTSGGTGAGGDSPDRSTAGRSGQPGRRPISPARRRRTTRRLAVVFVLLAGAIAYLLVEGLGSSLDYFDTVSQAIAHKDKIGTSVIRLEGTVVKGSVTRTAEGADFQISGGGHQVPVVNVGSLPTLFQPTIPVVVVGHFASDGSRRFLSDQIEVKHSASYIAQHPGRVKGKSGKVAP